MQVEEDAQVVAVTLVPIIYIILSRPSLQPTPPQVKETTKIFYSRRGGGEVVKNQHWSSPPPPSTPQRTPTLFPKCIKVQLNKKKKWTCYNFKFVQWKQLSG